MKKKFQIEADRLKGSAMAEGGYFVLPEVVRHLILDKPSHSKLLSKEANADRKALELTEKLEVLDGRIRRGLELIVAKVKKH